MEDSTAIVLQLENLQKKIGTYLNAHSPAAAAGLGAHLTLLFPFLPGTAVHTDEIATLRRFFSDRKPLQISLIGTARFPGLLYLTLANEASIRRLVGELRDQFPGLPPFAGQFSNPTPHVTIARADDDRTLDRLENLFWQRYRHLFPLALNVRKAALIQERDGRLHAAHSFSFGG
jgi:2'-5' RNA ligase